MSLSLFIYFLENMLYMEKEIQLQESYGVPKVHPQQHPKINFVKKY